jgi:hypothetical protein
MELIGSLFIVLALAVVVALFIGRPFLLRTGQGEADGTLNAEQEREHLTSALLAERDRVLNSLQELDFDYSLGKIPPEDYPQQRAVLLNTGAEVLRRLDGLATDAQSSSELAAEDRIEAAVAARRADAVEGTVVQPVELQPEMQPVVVGTNGNGKGKDELEEIIALRKRQRKESAAGFCPRCGKPVQKSDKFCSKCGATL